MFPIRDSRGRVIAFGGRVLGQDEPKYLNSPETALFHKGRELYGLYEARRSARKLERVLVVEGYMDVVSLAGHGIRNAVATLGTATTGEHLRRLFRATQEVVFCFDGDRAGRDAAWRALQNSLPELRDTRQVRFLFLPDGEDPDSPGPQGGRRSADTAAACRPGPCPTTCFDSLRAEADTGSLDGRARLAELAKPLLQQPARGRLPGTADGATGQRGAFAAQTAWDHCWRRACRANPARAPRRHAPPRAAEPGAPRHPVAASLPGAGQPVGRRRKLARVRRSAACRC